MTTAVANPQTPKLPILKNSVYTMVAAFVGVVFGVLGSLGFMTNYLHSQFAAQTASLNHRIVSMQTAADVSMCTVPTTSTSTGATTSSKPTAITAAAALPAGSTWTAPTPPTGGKGGGTPPPSFVTQLVTGDISDTGPDSTNTITAKDTSIYKVTNNNDISVSSSNSQSASTGSAKVDDNTTAGAATTGDATNVNTTDDSFDVSN